MNTGSRDERDMLTNIERCAVALERIADAVERTVYGATASEVRKAGAELAADAKAAGLGDVT